ncbi:CARDB domain-containing protein [Candidatus Aenigmatarchaeota archaeon]
MNKTILLIVLTIVVLGTLGIVSAQTDIQLPFFTYEGDLFLLEEGETEDIKIRGGRITVELLEIDYNPDEVSDVMVHNLTFSNDNPMPGENVNMSVLLTNIGTGAAHTVSVKLAFGDEGQGGGSHGMPVIPEILPGETVELEFSHVYEEEGYYTVMVLARVDNDIDLSNNIICEEIQVGDPQGSHGGGCGGMAGTDAQKKAHIIYTKYRGSHVIDEQELWLTQDDIGLVVEIIKLDELRSLMTVPR